MPIPETLLSETSPGNGGASDQNLTDHHTGSVAGEILGPAIVVMEPIFPVPDQGVSQTSLDDQSVDADARDIDPAIVVTTPALRLLDQGVDLRVNARPIDPAKDGLMPYEPTPDQDDGLSVPETHTGIAVVHSIGPTIQDTSSDESMSGPQGDDQSSTDSHSGNVVPLLVELWRQRQDLRRAEKRLDLQCQAICRRASGGDKEVAGKLWAKVKAGTSGEPALLMLLSPYTDAMASLDASAKGLEKELVRMVRAMPLWTAWGHGVRGMAELSLAGLIGEASRTVSEYRSVSALWKRFGLAVIDGGRQRLVAGAELALLHGYAPQRRAYAYVLSTNLMRSQRAEDPYRALYDRRKAYELERGLPKAHAHNRALRVMVKRLLQDAWVADRALLNRADCANIAA